MGLTCPLGNDLATFRRNLLDGVSGVSTMETRFMGKVFAGICNFDERKYQSANERRRGTPAGAISIFYVGEALANARLDLHEVGRSRVGVFIGVTEHGTVETENEINVIQGLDCNTKCWSHDHNPRTVANNPAGEVTINMGIRGPHYTIGAACAAGNAGLIQGMQMLRLARKSLWPFVVGG